MKGERSGRLWIRLLLALYPRSFRGRYGRDLEEFVRRQRTEPRYRRPVLGSLRYAWDVTLDGIKGALHTWRAETRRQTMGMGALAMSVRTALKILARNPRFTATVILTLGLGLGASTAVYSLANWLLLRPVPGVADPDRVVTVRFQLETHPGAWGLVSHPDLADLRSGTPALEALGATHETAAHAVLRGLDGLPRRLDVEVVTRGYFQALGVRPATGRLPLAGEDEDPRLVMLSHRVWTEAYGADAEVVGTVVTINGEPFTVTGVAPPGFRGPRFPESVTDLWLPVESHRGLLPTYPADVLQRRGVNLYFHAFGRLAPGATPEVAAEQLDAARAALVEAHADGTSLDRFVPTVEAGVGLNPWARDRLAVTLRILAGVVALLLLLGAANGANLLLARSVRRVRELRVRRALGAGRARLIAQLLTEGLLLGLGGGVAGLALAAGLLRLFEGVRLLPHFPALEGVSLDHRVLLFAVAVSVATGLLFALLPSLMAARSGDPGLRAGDGVSVRGGRLRTALVSGQVAISLALVVGAGLLLDTVRSLNDVALGFDPAGVVEVTVDPGTQGYDDERRVTFWKELVDVARSVPGVAEAGLAWAPLHGSTAADTRLVPYGSDADQEGVSTHSNYVSEGFLGAVGLEIVAGRDFLGDEVLAPEPKGVVLVSRSVAAELFPGVPPEGAVGRRVAISYQADRALEIVGIVADARVRGAKQESTSLFLQPLGASWLQNRATLYARGEATGERPSLASVRAAVAELDAALPVYDAGMLEDRVAGSFAEERLLATLTLLFAGLALTLAAVGLYGIISLTVAARTPELGLRMTLGAPGSALRTMVLRHALLTTALGVPLGLALAAGVARLVQSRLWGVTPLDPTIFSLAVVVLLATAFAASWIPARRVTRIDPVEALRQS